MIHQSVNAQRKPNPNTVAGQLKSPSARASRGKIFNFIITWIAYFAYYYNPWLSYYNIHDCFVTHVHTQPTLNYKMADSQSLLYFQRALSTLYILFWLLGWASTSWDGTEADRRNSESHRLFPRSSSNLSYEFSFATERFVSSLEATVEQLNSYRRPLLVHTRNGVRF